MFNLTLPPPGIVALLFALVTGAAAFDIPYRRIPNWLTASGMLAGVGMNAFLYPGWSGLRFSLAGLAFGFGVYFLLYILRAMGAGDVKLMGALGAMAGWQNWVGIFLITAIIGGVASLTLMTMRGRVQKTLWNAGFIVTEMMSGRAAYLANEELDVRSNRAVGLPHAAVVAAGTLVFLAMSAHYAA
jgi:prepilin peptidase CpaA